MIKRGTDLENFEILGVQLYMYSYVLEHRGWCYSKGEGNVTPRF